MKKSIIPSPSMDEDFSIIYNGEDVRISKYQFALYSRRFRQIPDFVTATSYEVKSEVPVEIFSEFVKGAQGIEVIITPEKVHAFLSLCEFWETRSFADYISKEFMNDPTIEEIIKRIHSASEGEEFNKLETLLVRKFDAALSVPSISSLPLERLQKIIFNPATVITKHGKYAKFVIQMLNKCGPDASILASKIDMKKLTHQEATELLKHPKLSKSFINDSLSEVAIALIQENAKYSMQVKENQQILTAILERLELLETAVSYADPDSDDSIRKLTKQVSALESKIKTGKGGDITVLTDRLSQMESKLESLYKASLEDANAKCSQAALRAHKDLKKTNKIVNGLTKRSGTIDSSLASLKTEMAELKDKLDSCSVRADSCREAMKGIKSTKPVANSSPKLLAAATSRPVAVTPPKPKNPNILECPFGGQALDGIVAKLTKKLQGNIHIKGAVKISASTSDHNEPYQIADYNWKDVFFTENRPNSWLMFDFLDKKVDITHYTLKTHKYPSGQCHIKTWIVEGSNNGTNWDELDRRTTPVLNGGNKFQTFPTATSCGDRYRLIRLRQIGSNCRGDNVLSLCNMELFGTVYPYNL